MKLNELSEIVRTYEKHGWKLREIIVAAELSEESTAKIRQDLGNVKIRLSDVDAAWFSRASDNSNKAWELRLIGEQQIALFETVSIETSAESSNQVRKEMETHLARITSKRRSDNG